MRTTLTIDDELIRLLKQRAQESGRPFKVVVNEAIRTGLEQSAITPDRRPYHVESFALGCPARDVDLEKALQLAGNLEVMELARKLELRK